MKKFALTFLAAVVLLGGLPTRAHAVFTFTLSQVGNNVTLDGIGSLNLTGFSGSGTNQSVAEILPASGVLTGGPVAATGVTIYGGLSGPAAFDSGAQINANSGGGNPVGVCMECSGISSSPKATLQAGP